MVPTFTRQARPTDGANEELNASSDGGEWEAEPMVDGCSHHGVGRGLHSRGHGNEGGGSGGGGGRGRDKE